MNEWVRFADSKAAILIAANAAVVFGLLQSGWSFDEYRHWNLYLWPLVAGCVISTFFCFLALVPALSFPWLTRPGQRGATVSLIYFADIAKFTPKQFLEALAQAVGYEQDPSTAHDLDLARQIVTNSTIALNKYRLMTVAFWATLAGLISVPVFAVFILLRGRLWD
ncbi:MAG: DUF5706 domain-containing protein [Pseudomonadales bacterium]